MVPPEVVVGTTVVEDRVVETNIMGLKMAGAVGEAAGEIVEEVVAEVVVVIVEEVVVAAVVVIVEEVVVAAVVEAKADNPLPGSSRSLQRYTRVFFRDLGQLFWG